MKMACIGSVCKSIVAIVRAELLTAATATALMPVAIGSFFRISFPAALPQQHRRAAGDARRQGTARRAGRPLIASGNRAHGIERSAGIAGMLIDRHDVLALPVAAKFAARDELSLARLSDPVAVVDQQFSP